MNEIGNTVTLSYSPAAGGAGCEPAYRLRDLRVEYASRQVLGIPALDLGRGKVTVIVGPNGAGKSTLLRVMAFLLQPTAGTVEFGGQVVTHRPRELASLRRQATYIAQAPLLFHRSVYANVAYGLRVRRLPSDGRVDAALRAVGLSGFGHRQAWKLSGGEAQRVSIARALAVDPPVYLFDEPTANIDREFVPIIESVLIDLGTAGKTVVLTTHNPEQAYRLSDTVVSLERGRVASPPLVNLLRGTTVRIDDRYYFESARLRIEMPDDSCPRIIAIDADDIIVSRAPLDSSARNCFPGQISQVARDERGIVLTVDCGRSLLVRITPHSYEEMALNIGAQVYVTFKSSAIHTRAES